MTYAKTLYAVDRDNEPYTLAEAICPEAAMAITASVMFCEPHRLSARAPTSAECRLFRAKGHRFNSAGLALAVLRIDGYAKPLFRAVSKTPPPSSEQIAS